MYREMYREEERRIEAVVYIVSLIEASFRFSEGNNDAFNIDVNSVEYLHCRCCPFLQDFRISYRKAHKQFCASIIEAGWRYAEIENFSYKESPEIVPYDELDIHYKQKLAFRAAIIQSAIEFYNTLSAELRSEIPTGIFMAVPSERVH